jgi:hypothetical protein
MPRFTVKGYIRIPCTLTVENCRSIGEALAVAESRTADLAKSSVKVLKEQAPNLVGELFADGAAGVVSSVAEFGEAK